MFKQTSLVSVIVKEKARAVGETVRAFSERLHRNPLIVALLFSGFACNHQVKPG